MGSLTRPMGMLCAAVLIGGCGGRTAAPTPEDISAALRKAVEVKRPALAAPDDDERAHHVWQEEQRFYRQNGYQLVWTDGKRPRRQVDGLIAALRAAADEGLEPADYRVDELDAARTKP